MKPLLIPIMRGLIAFVIGIYAGYTAHTTTLTYVRQANREASIKYAQERQSCFETVCAGDVVNMTLSDGRIMGAVITEKQIEGFKKRANEDISQTIGKDLKP